MPTHLKKDLENGGDFSQSEQEISREMPNGGCGGEVEKESWWWIGGTDGFS